MTRGVAAPVSHTQYPLPTLSPLLLPCAAGPDPRFRDDGGPARPPTVLEIQEFLWNRMRAVARDLTLQNYGAAARNDALAIETNERMVRASALFSQELVEEPMFRWTLNEERMNAYLKTLMDLYNDARSRRIPGVVELESPNVSAAAAVTAVERILPSCRNRWCQRR